jgi:hypothetical protein
MTNCHSKKAPKCPTIVFDIHPNKYTCRTKNGRNPAKIGGCGGKNNQTEKEDEKWL